MSKTNNVFNSEDVKGNKELTSYLDKQEKPELAGPGLNKMSINSKQLKRANRIDKTTNAKSILSVAPNLYKYIGAIVSEGYFCIPRSLSRDPLFQDLNSKVRILFFTLVDRALYFSREYDIYGKKIHLFPGQICTTHILLVNWCGGDVSRNDVQRGLKKLEELGFIKVEKIVEIEKGQKTSQTLSQTSRQKKTVITISHQETYELILRATEAESEPNFEPNLSQTRAKLEPQSNKEKKEKKENKKKEIHKEKVSLLEFFPYVKISQEDHDDLVKSHGEVFTQQCYERLSNWKSEKGESTRNSHSDMGRITHWVINTVKKENLEKKEIEIREKELEMRTKRLSNSYSGAILDNKDWIKDILKGSRIPKSVDIELFESHFEIRVSGSAHATTIQYNEKGFKDQAQSAIRKYGISLQKAESNIETVNFNAV